MTDFNRDDIIRHHPNKHCKKYGGSYATSEITHDPKEVSEVGPPYNLMGSGATPEELRRVMEQLESTYPNGPPPPPPVYEAKKREEYVPDPVEIDPIPPCLREMFDASSVFVPDLSEAYNKAAAAEKAAAAGKPGDATGGAAP